MASEALSYDLKYKIFRGKHAPGDNTMSHNTFHGHPGSYEIRIFGMHGMGVALQTTVICVASDRKGGSWAPHTPPPQAQPLLLLLDIVYYCIAIIISPSSTVISLLSLIL